MKNTQLGKAVNTSGSWLAARWTEKAGQEMEQTAGRQEMEQTASRRIEADR